MKKVKEIFHDIDCKIFGNPDREVDSIEFDSGKVKSSSLFVALKGKNIDSHSLIKDIYFKRGCSAFVVEDINRVDSYVKNKSTLIKVENSRRALSKISKNFYEQKTKVVGVTGTKGKSSTVKIIGQSLCFFGKRCGVLGSLWWKLTTPEAPDIFRIMNQSYFDIWAMEVTSVSTVQHRIDDVEFEWGIFLGLGRDHLDIHGTIENYFLAKYNFLEKPKSLIIFLDEWGRKAYELLKSDYPNKKIITFSDKNFLYDAGKISIFWEEEKISFSPKFFGSFNCINFTASYILLREMGFKPDSIKLAFEEVFPPRGRMELVVSKPMVFVDYAHTPDSLSSVIDECLKLKIEISSKSSPKLIVVFGCGGDRDKGKRPEMGRVSMKADRVILTSDNPRSENPEDIIKDILQGIYDTSKVIVEPDRKKAIFKALSEAKENDIVLIAGKGHEEYQVIKDKFLPFSDRKVVLEFFRNMGRN